MDKFLLPKQFGCLNDDEIEKLADNAIERGEGGELHIGPSSIDLHLAPEKIEIEGGLDGYSPETTFTVSDEDSYPRVNKHEGGVNPVVVQPGEFCLARTDEYLDLPPGVMALMHGRSSVGRLGLFVENAGLVDRGFEGTLTLELFNPTNNEIKIPAQTRVAQLVFFYQGGEPENAYDGKYQGQHDTTPSRLYEDG